MRLKEFLENKINNKEINFGSPYSDYAYDTIESILKERKKKKIEI